MLSGGSAIWIVPGKIVPLRPERPSPAAPGASRQRRRYSRRKRPARRGPRAGRRGHESLEALSACSLLDSRSPFSTLASPRATVSSGIASRNAQASSYPRLARAFLKALASRLAFTLTSPRFLALPKGDVPDLHARPSRWGLADSVSLAPARALASSSRYIGSSRSLTERHGPASSPRRKVPAASRRPITRCRALQ